MDGSASNDGSSLMEELRVAFLLHRLNSSKAAPSGYDILKMATRGSARLLGRDDIGQLAIGKCADLFLIDSRRLELVETGIWECKNALKSFADFAVCWRTILIVFRRGV